MDKLILEANYRADTTKGRTKQLRREGFVTGNVFGHDSESVAVEVKLQDLLDQIKKSKTGVKSLIELKINGAPKKSDGTVLIKDFLKDALTRKVLDIQFQRVSMKEKIHVGVPLEFVGEAPGIKDGGMLEQMLDELQVLCLPGVIPGKVEVDISNLQINGMIRVEDLNVPDGVEVLAEPDALVASCRASYQATAAAKAEAESEATAEGAAAE